MHLKLLKLITFLLIFTGCFISCKKTETKVTDVQLNKTELTLNIDETETLIATVFPKNADNKVVSWKSDDSKVVIVDNGKITAKNVGATIITVTSEDGNHKATCTIKVTQSHPAEPEMVFVEGGTFIMGCTDDECISNEYPQHQVTLSSFKIAKYPVTQLQWEAVMGSNASGNKGENLPVKYITWHDAQAFITKLNTLTDKNYRLPTEAEWEYAARGGNKSKGYKYSGSDNIDEVAWYSGNSENKAHPVGTKKPNELDIYDMSGNVYEWCNDWAGAYTEEPQINPQGPTTGSQRIIRGGNYHTNEWRCRVSARFAHAPSSVSRTPVGFRLVLP